MTKTANETITTATYATAHFSEYRPGDETYVFSVAAGDADGRVIHGEAHMPRWSAVQDAIYILTAATLDGLTDDERAKLRELAEMRPAFCKRAA